MTGKLENHGSSVANGTDHGHAPARPFERLKLLLQPERRDIMAVVVFALAVAILSLATPIAVETLVNTVAFGVLVWPVIVIAGVLMSCLGLAAAIRAMQVYVIELLQRRLFVRVVADYAHRLPWLKVESLDGQHGPELANRFFDIVNIQKSVGFLLLDGVALVVTAVVGMCVIAFYHPFLLGFNVIVIFLVSFTLFVLGWGGVTTSLHESHAKYDVAAWFEEVLRCLRTFKFAEGRHLALTKADELANHWVTARSGHFRVVWRQTMFSLALQVVASTALLGLGGFLVVNRQLTLGQLVAAELIVTLVVASVAKLGKYTETFYDLMSGAEKLGLLTDIPLEREHGESVPKKNMGLSIRVDGISDVSSRKLGEFHDWRIAPNERVAIVGPPGSGKTTLFEVLCGLREPREGIVEFDGVDLRGISLESLRKQIAYVEASEIFVGTVNENIRLGRDHLTLEEIRIALEAVGMLDVIYGLPLGLETPLMPTGKPLSGSQSIRLTLARALVGRPRMLIIDGALDALNLRECPALLPYLFDPKNAWTLLVASTESVILDLCDRVIHLGGDDEAEEASDTERGVS